MVLVSPELKGGFDEREHQRESPVRFQAPATMRKPLSLREVPCAKPPFFEPQVAFL
jgi:hypothetical protein